MSQSTSQSTSQRIYVGNLPASVTGDEIRELFSEFGTVEWVNLVREIDTGRSRGFGYVKMADGVAAAVRALDRRRLDGRRLDVRRALPLSRGDISRLRTPRRARLHPPTEASIWSVAEPLRVNPARVCAL